MGSHLDEALRLRALGWNVVAAPPRGKSPLGQWRRWQSERVPERFVKEAFEEGEPNLFVITGAVSRLCVLDCDDEMALRWWHEQLGDTLKKTARAKTAKGYHFYFNLEDGQVEKGRSSVGGDSGKWDLRAEGGGVIAPPSMHKSGARYEWVEGHEPELTANAPSSLFGIRVGDSAEGNQSPTSTLRELLGAPPGPGGRNNWLTRVAGHYAKFIPHADAYDWHIEQANRLLTEPLRDEELEKLRQSIWNTELAKQGRLAPEVVIEGEQWRAALVQPAEETGWLVSGRYQILVQCKKPGKDGEHYLSRWMDADLRVVGIVDSEEQRIYEVEILQRNEEPKRATLPAAAIADTRALVKWLANWGATIGEPDYISPSKMSIGARLIRYLEAQNAPRVMGVDCLGWHDESESFLTHEGVIKKAEQSGFDSVRPTVPRGWAPYHYGFTNVEDARETLREILTFHDETVAGVFGAWWAACFLKPQILQKASQFPFMALEAASESGKTTGFFSLMLRLSGNREGHNISTRAALRDSLSAHRSGIVWMDDLDSLEYVGELLRASTVEGGLTKKDIDNRGQVAVKMRAALVISGESLGLGGQKALLDRAILLEVGSPVNRRSIRDPERLQWLDIESLRGKWPDLTAHAGTLVQLALGQQNWIHQYESLRRGAGRHADKLAILRVGARVLAGMLGSEADEWIITRVDDWIGEVKDPGAENALTLKLLPAALARFGWPSRPEGSDRHPGGMSATPAFVDEEGIVWFTPGLVSEWWAKEARGRGKKASERTESEEGLRQQAVQLGTGRKLRKTFRLDSGDGYKQYWPLPPNYSRAVIERSHD